MKNINEIREYVANNEEAVAEELLVKGFYANIEHLTYMYVINVLKNISEEEANAIDNETVEYVYGHCWNDEEDESYNIPENISNIICEKAKWLY